MAARGAARALVGWQERRRTDGPGWGVFRPTRLTERTGHAPSGVRSIAAPRAAPRSTVLASFLANSYTFLFIVEPASFEPGIPLMKDALVTGGAGFIGSNIAGLLLQKGCR